MTWLPWAITVASLTLSLVLWVKLRGRSLWLSQHAAVRTEATSQGVPGLAWRTLEGNPRNIEVRRLDETGHVPLPVGWNYAPAYRRRQPLTPPLEGASTVPTVHRPHPRVKR